VLEFNKEEWSDLSLEEKVEYLSIGLDSANRVILAQQATLSSLARVIYITFKDAAEAPTPADINAAFGKFVERVDEAGEQVRQRIDGAQWS
jgi:hypothetical protein